MEALDKQPLPDDALRNLSAFSLLNDFSPIGSCNFSRITENDVLRMHYMFCSVEECRAFKSKLRRQRLYERRQQLQREWSRTFFLQQNLLDFRLAGFFSKYPGLRPFIGTKIMLFSDL